jgi:hypothetical protein
MTNSERIEAYFNNELQEAEKQQLLNDVDSDPSLKSEFQFQEDIVDGIKAYRKKELISRLDNVPIAVTGQSVILKTLGVIGIAGIATLSTYIWINNNSDKELVAGETDKIEKVLTKPNLEPEEINDSTSLTNNDVIDHKISASDDEVNGTKETTASIPEIVMPEVIEPDSSSDAIAEDNLEAPEAMNSSEVTLNTSTNVEVKFSKKYNFHYQVTDDQLTLYGEFDDAPFEVLEMKTNKGIQSYLFYNDNFYGLNSKSKNIEPLQVIKNEELIKELQKRR